MGLMGDIFEMIGLGGISGLDVLFAGAAVVGTVLFVLYFILVLIGGVADGALDAVGFDVDFEADATGFFHLLTIQGILSFIMCFGIFGLAASQAGNGAMLAIIVGVVTGVISMWMISKVFQMMYSLESDGTVKYHEAIGAKGTVYQSILPGEAGKVQVEFTGALRTSTAVASDESIKIDTGKFIKVVGNVGETLVVEPMSAVDASKEVASEREAKSDE